MITTATQEILEEDGAETALTELAEKVREAEAALREVLFENPARTWTIKELQDTAAEHQNAAVERRYAAAELRASKKLTPTALGIAFARLQEAGEVSVGADLRVHALQRLQPRS